MDRRIHLEIRFPWSPCFVDGEILYCGGFSFRAETEATPSDQAQFCTGGEAETSRCIPEDDGLLEPGQDAGHLLVFPDERGIEGHVELHGSGRGLGA